MKLIFAKNIGFCSGVKRTVMIAEEATKNSKRPVQFLGSLVHNEKVIEKFKKKRVRFIKYLKEAEPGTLIIQAHGIPPFSKKIMDELVIKDATCPLVKRVQLIARDLQDKGFKVVIIGDKKHPESKGIKGYAKNKAIIVENVKQAENLPKFKKIGVVIQTTQNLKKVNKILKILKKKTKEIVFKDTICPEVKIRQEELSLILKKADAVLVIGSKNSANTKELVNIAKEAKKPVWLANSPEELNKDVFNVPILGITSGTSAPNWEINKIKKWLEEKQR
ncbi:MAG: 4-hydroxy-3-methylbut-2-enyl diphosphate reductase [Candidatus Nealsonbacteria bacterium]